MPRTQVSTWDEFVTAYRSSQGSTSDPHVIEIMADLDAKSSITQTISAGSYYKVINGNYHNISNIATATTSVAIILSGNYVTWNKCNFLNIYRNTTFGVFYADSSLGATFYDCVFQGQGYRICGGSGASGQADNAGYGRYNRCVITWIQSSGLGTYTGAAFGYATLNLCYLDVTIYSNTVQNTALGTLNGCFVKGRLTSSTNTHAGHLYNGGNNVINIDTPLNFTNGLISATTQITSVYNTTKMTGTILDRASAIGVTDAQMHDAAYLQSIGFDIVA